MAEQSLAERLEEWQEHLTALAQIASEEDAMVRVAIGTALAVAEDCKQSVAELRRLEGEVGKFDEQLNAHRLELVAENDRLREALRVLGQCGRCNGDGEESHVDDDGQEITEECPACDGSGLEPEASAALAPAKGGEEDEKQ